MTLNFRRMIASISGTELEMRQNVADARPSPKRIHKRGTGMEISLSSVWALVSIGKITGPTAVAEKKTTIAIRPGISVTGSMLLPTTKERKKKNGKRRPKIIVGPFV